MFDEYLRERAQERGEEFREFDAVGDYDEYVDGKPRYEGVRSFLGSRGHRPAPGLAERPARRGHDRRPGQPQERAGARADPRDGASGLRRLGALRQGGPRRRAATAVVSSSTNCRDVLVAAGHRGPVRRDRRRGRRRARASGRQARARHVPRRRPASSASRPAHAAVFEDALAGVEAGHAGQLRLVVGVDRVGQADALEQHGADVVVEGPGRAAGATRDPPPCVSLSSPWEVCETELRPRPAGAARVGVRPVQRPHRAARQPRRRGAARAAGHVPRRRSTSCARCPTARADTATPRRPDRHQRHQRQDHPAARRRRAVRRALRGAREPRARARPASRHAAPHARVVVAGAPARARQLDAPGLVHPARDRGDPLRGRVARRSLRIVVQSELVANETVPVAERRPARRRGARARRCTRAGRHGDTGPCWCTRTTVERADDGGGDGPRARGAAGHRTCRGGLRGRRRG